MNLYLKMKISFKKNFPKDGIFVWFDGIKFKYKGKEYYFFEEDDADVSYGFTEINKKEKYVTFVGKIKGMMFIDNLTNFHKIHLNIEDVFGQNFDAKEFELLEIACPLSCDDDDDDDADYEIREVCGLEFESWITENTYSVDDIHVKPQLM